MLHIKMPTFTYDDVRRTQRNLGSVVAQKRPWRVELYEDHIR